MLDTAIKAAKIGGQIIFEHWRKESPKSVAIKSDSDYVTEIDRQSQSAIIEFIRKCHPHHAIMAEETEEELSGSEYRWIIDPLDGTTNYIHGLPVFAVSVAVEKLEENPSGIGEIIAGAVFDPVREDIYYAEKGAGAFRNGKKIQVSGRNDMKSALLATGFPFRDKDYLETFFRIFRSMFEVCSDIRRAGAAALDLCWVAEGALDGFWEKGLKPWDIAAGSLIIREAGGVVSDMEGGGDCFTTGNILAGTPEVFREMLKILSELRVKR